MFLNNTVKNSRHLSQKIYNYRQMWYDFYTRILLIIIIPHPLFSFLVIKIIYSYRYYRFLRYFLLAFTAFIVSDLSLTFANVQRMRLAAHLLFYQSPWPKGNEGGWPTSFMLSGSHDRRTRAYFLRKFLANKLAIASSLSTLRKTYKTRRRRRSTGRYTGERKTRHHNDSIQRERERERERRSRKRENWARSFLARFWGWRIANNVTTDIELQNTLFLEGSCECHIRSQYWTVSREYT